jgi:hypothetical protein
MDEITLPLVQRAVAGERAAMEQIMRAPVNARVQAARRQSWP